jgi:hypothetical protein
MADIRNALLKNEINPIIINRNNKDNNITPTRVWVKPLCFEI